MRRLLADVRPLPVHHYTGLRALGYTKHGKPIWPVKGGDGTGDGGQGGSGGGGGGTGSGGGGGTGGDSGTGGNGGGTGGQGGGSGEGGNDGWPANTRVEDMTPQQQANYWKSMARKHEDRVKGMKDYDDLKSKAAEYDKLAEASKTEQEKAVEAARAEGKTEGRREAGEKLVRAEITVQLGDRMNTEQRQGLLDGLALANFLKADGDVDTDKVKTFVDRIAPATGNGNGNGGGAGRAPRDLGQGRRSGDGARPTVASGAELYRKLRPSSAPKTN